MLNFKNSAKIYMSSKKKKKKEQIKLFPDKVERICDQQVETTRNALGYYLAGGGVGIPTLGCS